MGGCTKNCVYHQLEPYRETIHTPGWWHLKWRPIRRSKNLNGLDGTWNFYSVRIWGDVGLVIRKRRDSGWGASNEKLQLELYCWSRAYIFWVKWDFQCQINGPIDLKCGALNVPITRGD